METIIFNCKVITPMFLAGADGQTPELRAPSIKGAIRFWWRAMNGHWGLAQMMKHEQELFGGVGNGKASRSKVILKVENQNLKIGKDILPQNQKYRDLVPGTNKSSNVLEYLAYGVLTRPGNIDREYFVEGGEFDLVITLPELYKKVITDVVRLVSCFGGLGSRSRNGYGSFCVQGITETSVEVFKEFKTGNLQLYSAFSERARLFVGSNHYEKWEDALFEVGNAYRMARLGLENRHSGEIRKYISQPLFIKDSITGKNKLLSPDNPKKDMERNAKCFFLGLTEEKIGFRGHILYLPHNMKGHAKYLEQNNALADSLRFDASLNEIL